MHHINFLTGLGGGGGGKGVKEQVYDERNPSEIPAQSPGGIFGII